MTTNAQTFIVSDADQGQRLDRFLSDRLPDLSREKIKKAVQSGDCTVDMRRVSVPKSRVLTGQHVCLEQPEGGEECVRAEEGAIDCLWHDEHLALLHKPAGLTVHPCPSCPEGTLVHRLVGYFPQLHQQEGLRPGIVHRLDKDTSGLILIALTEAARLRMSEAFAEREVHKEYLALVHGVPPEEGDVDEPLGRHPSIKVKMAVVPEEQGGRPALSHWQRVYADPEGRFALLCVRIFTGRTHQIRVHMAHAGYPLWGDSLYGPRVPAGDYTPPRQMLHAWQLAFTHPVSGEEMVFKCPPPADFVNCFQRLTWRMQRVIITGNPGCGKSALTEALGREGLPTWSADEVLKTAYAPHADAWLFLRQRYGDRFIPHDEAPVNRTALRHAMNENPAIRREVEAYTHALARHSLEVFWQACQKREEAVSVAEVPLYLEAHWQEATKNAQSDGMDSPLLIGVDCPPAARQHRVELSRGWDAATLAAIEAWQWPIARKLKACHSVVDNSGTLADLQHKAATLVEQLTLLRRNYAAECLAKAPVLTS
ncbi:MAG: dephospho-CoA kinase [Desulfovibrionaceae bacterium]